jgi:hypothetical protein
MKDFAFLGILMQVIRHEKVGMPDQESSYYSRNETLLNYLCIIIFSKSFQEWTCLKMS